MLRLQTAGVLWVALAVWRAAASSSMPANDDADLHQGLSSKLARVFNLTADIIGAHAGTHSSASATPKSELREALGMLLDVPEAHYRGLLRRMHELHDPVVAALLQVSTGDWGSQTADHRARFTAAFCRHWQS